MELFDSNTKKILIFFYISGNGKNKKILYISGNRNPKKLPIFQKMGISCPTKKLNKTFLKFLAPKILIKLPKEKLDA